MRYRAKKSSRRAAALDWILGERSQQTRVRGTSRRFSRPHRRCRIESLESRMVLSAAPIAAADLFQAAYDTALTVDAPGVLANDSDGDGNTLTAVQVSGPAHGQLTWNGDGAFSYAPHAGFIGTDSFTYRANDGTAYSDVATVTIQVLPVIHVGDHLLAPDQAGQTLPVYASGGFPVQGVNFNLQVADAGPEGNGSVDGPVLQDLDILGGTIFAANNNGVVDIDGEGSPDIVPQFEGRDTTTVSGTVITEGLLGTVTVDTTGFTSGQWPLVMSMTVNGASDFTVVPAVVFDGFRRRPRLRPFVGHRRGPGSVATLDAVTGYRRQSRHRVRAV